MQKNRLAVNFYFLINGFLYAGWVSRLPELQTLYGINNSQTGMVLLFLATGALLAMPFTGYLIVKNGSQKVTRVSALLFCLFIPLLPFFSKLTTLVLLFFLMGMSTGVMDVAINAQAVLVEQMYKKPIMSSFHALFSGGMMLGAGIASFFAGWTTSLSFHFLTVVAFAIPLVIWSNINLVRDEKAKSDKEKGASFVLPAKSLWGIGFICFCCMLGEGAMADWSTNYMRNIAFSDPVLAPAGLGAFSTAMMLGRILGDKGRMLLGDRKLLIINSMIALSGVLIFVTFPMPLVVITGMFLVGLGLSVIVPIAYSTAGSMKDLTPGVGISMVTTIGYSGFLFGPPIIGFMADWKGLRVAMIFLAGLFVLMALLTLINNRSVKTLEEVSADSKY